MVGVLIAAAEALVIASAGPAPAAAGSGTDAQLTAARADTAATTTATTRAPAAHVPPEFASRMARIYAAAVRELVGGSSGPPRVLYVMKRFCPDPAAAPPPMRCGGALLPPQVRQAIVAALRGRAYVSYILDGQTVTLPDLRILNNGTVLSLGRARFEGDSVLVPLATRSGPLAGMGLTYRLAHRHGQWEVIEIRHGWIS